MEGRLLSDEKNVGFYPLYVIIINAYFVFVSIGSVVYSCIRLRGPGTNREILGVIVRRTIVQTIIFGVCNIGLAIDIYHDFVDEDRDKDYLAFNYFLFASQGIFFFMGRVMEPYTKQVYKDTFMDLLCLRNNNSDNDDKYENDKEM
eukprot:CAMPEP_0176342118 /NCGR_PEP_ID=MMETSP0126-20121128/2925_1 /TAXON_ID=141414 ORGANISM="Strombidinopsis acuminatum, Strain SPMC142" /NCGR_SAMPLE_ID=MMETSP0126 /ASSEMBLY_ACC=CAM_ASM_000229 /LENGTH=145 /DNA_ID=CAMNT_0017687349 /DNA_START=510 /DNA_END=947 /DNA_ORIENTATION=-